MTYPVELGSVREVWFAPTNNPTDKNSFLIRDDAFSMKGQSFGRTIRLGDPVNLGPNSSWTQLSWEGGIGQEIWTDKAMYQEGSADPQTKTGKLRPWTGFVRLHAEASGRLFDHFKFAKSGTNQVLQPLYIAESNRWRQTTPSGGFRIYLYRADTGTLSYLSGGPCNGANAIRAMCAIQTDQEPVGTPILAVATLAAMWTMEETSGKWFWDTGFVPSTYGHVVDDSFVNFNNGLYFLADNSLIKRAPGAFGVVGIYTRIRQVQSALFLRGITVYNNRIYYGVHYPGARSAVEVSDGVTAQRVFDFPEPFWISGMVAHYGSLYIVGAKPSASGPSVPGGRATDIGQVWRYNGSSLTKLWEEGDINDNKKHGIDAVATFNQNLVWTRNGFPQSGGTGSGQTAPSGSHATLRPCLMFYDVEKDAIFEGPGIDCPTSAGVDVSNVFAWDNTLVASFTDLATYNQAGCKSPVMMAGMVRQADLVRNKIAAIGTPNNSFGLLDNGTKSQFVLSSRYHGEDDVALEPKTWLNAKLRARIPANTQVRLAVLLDEGSEQAIQTLTGDGTWQTFTVPLKVAGAYLQSTTLQYKVYVENTDTNVDSTAIPEVDDLYIQWRVTPTLQRTWNVRLLLQDAQLRLDDSANALTTRSAMHDKLQSYYESGQPVVFYVPNTGEGATGESHEVVVTDFQSQSYRIDTGGTEVMEEVSLVLMENVL